MVPNNLPQLHHRPLALDGGGFAVAIAREVDVGGFEQALTANSQRHLAFLRFCAFL